MVKNKLGQKKRLLKVFLNDGKIVGAYKRSSVNVSTYQNATYEDLQTAELNIIDPENEYQR